MIKLHGSTELENTYVFKINIRKIDRYQYEIKFISPIVFHLEKKEFIKEDRGSNLAEYESRKMRRLFYNTFSFAQAASQSMQIFIRLSQSNVCLTIDVESTDTIETAKRKIATARGIPVDQPRPRYRLMDKRCGDLDNNRTFDSYNIEKETTLNLIDLTKLGLGD